MENRRAGKFACMWGCASFSSAAHGTEGVLACKKWEAWGIVHILACEKCDDCIVHLINEATTINEAVAEFERFATAHYLERNKMIDYTNPEISRDTLIWKLSWIIGRKISDVIFWLENIVQLQ